MRWKLDLGRNREKGKKKRSNMEWNLKTTTRDFTKFEQGTVANIDGVSGSSSYTGHGIKSDFSVDLKLGHVIDTGNEATNVSKMTLSPSGSAKRARAIGVGVETTSCLVDGCNADLSFCREYHRRHKVCEVHSKTPEVRINGVKQRFCQQCSRFHSLEEFDDGKRSCRKRLDGHNRRRRKPLPETSHSGSFFSKQGSTMLQFSSPQVYTTTAVTNPIWAGVVKAEEDVKFYYPHRQISFPESSSSSSIKGPGHQFSLFHSTNRELNNHTPRKTSTCQQLLSTITSSETSSSRDKMFCDGFPSQDCAPSLLSSSQTQTSCIGPSHVMQSNLIPYGHPLDSGLTYSSLEPMESILVQNGTGDPDAHCQGMFHMAPHASRNNETPQTLPFYWE